MFEIRRAQSFCAIGLCLWSAAVIGRQAASSDTLSDTFRRQTAPPAALSDALRAHVKNEQYYIVTSIRGLPLGVRAALQTLWGSGTLDIADPGDEFQRGDVVVNRSLPLRRLVAAGCSPDNHCLVYYERSGKPSAWLVTLFHWTPDATRLEFAGTAPAGLKTVEDVRKAVLSGAIKGPNSLW